MTKTLAPGKNNPRMYVQALVIFLVALLARGIFYFILMHAAMNVQFRFICPMMPYGIMIAVFTASQFFDVARKVPSR